MPEYGPEKLYQRVFEYSLSPLAVTDPQGKFILVNFSWSRLMGYSQAEAQQLALEEIILPKDQQECHDNLLRLGRSEADRYQKLIQVCSKGSTKLWVNLSLFSIRDTEGITTEILAFFQDVDTQIRGENQLEDMNLTLEAVNVKLQLAYREIQQKNNELTSAYHKLGELARTDTLTGLPNRLELEEQLQQEVHRFSRNQHEFSLCLADIDDFKLVNDTYGHDTGDAVLKEIARIFKDSTRTSDIIGRWGGEEFLFILPETQVLGALVLMERVRLYVMEHRIQTGTAALSVTITLGCSSFKAGSKLDDVIKQADLALYAGKKSGKNLAIRFEPALENIHSIPG